MDFSRIRTFPIRNRRHKVSLSMFGSTPRGGGFADLYDSLPDMLGARDLRIAAVAAAMASTEGREVVLAMGAHPIKCGLSPVIIDLMERGILTAVAMNGAGSIHDYEIASIGETSEDVEETLRDGSFGMVEETGRFMNRAMAAGVRENRGAGEAVGRAILEDGCPHGLKCRARGGLLGVHAADGADSELNGQAAIGLARGDRGLG